MIKIIKTCDKCGKDISAGTKEQTWNVRVQYICDKEFWEGSPSSSRTLLWCRSCLELTGIVPAIINKDLPIERKVNLEDFIREIVREEMEG